MVKLALLSPARRRNRAVWADPVRKLRTLEAFAKTEADGGKDIAAAARRVTDPELEQHLLRHADDEVRHAELFHRRAAELREAGGTTLVAAEDANAYDLTRGRPASEVDAHGFFNVAMIDDLGDVAYVAMLNIAEKNAAALFAMHRDLLWDDAETRAIFEEILKDEKYHVAYTSTILDKWRRDGRATEVKAAMTAAKGSRVLGAMKRAGIRMGAHFGRTLMLVLYYTILAPVGFAASRGRAAGGWQEPDPAAGDPLAGARQQY